MDDLETKANFGLEICDETVLTDNILLNGQGCIFPIFNDAGSLFPIFHYLYTKQQHRH